MKKLCLVLEGGGAKCAYQAGVLKALDIAGYKYDAIAGTSFGSFNGAMYIAGGMDKILNFWENLTPALMFEDEKLNDLMDKIYQKEKFLDKESLLHFIKEWKDMFGKYKKVSNMYHDLIIKNVDEEAIRKSNIEFALVTAKMAKIGKILAKVGLSVIDPVSIAVNQIVNKDKSFVENFFEMEALKLTKDEIPNHELANYVVASASIPPFKPIEIGKNAYIDGGVIDNVPYKLMEDKGYTEILVIRTNQGELTSEVDNVNLQVIEPSENLGSCAMFSEKNIKHLLELGYNDGVEFLKSSMGRFKFSFIKGKLEKNKY